MISFTKRCFLSVLGSVLIETLPDNSSFPFTSSGIGQVQAFAYSVTGLDQERT